MDKKRTNKNNFKWEIKEIRKFKIYLMNHQLIWILEVLYLFILGNKISDEGAKEIAESLETDDTLKYFDSFFLECTFFFNFR